MYGKYQSLATNKKTAGLLIVAELLVAYAVFSLMLETGNLGYYLFFVLLLIDSLRRLINLFKKSKNKVNAKKTKSKNPA